LAPTTTLAGDFVIINWIAPNSNGYEIFSYQIWIQTADPDVFATDSTDCDGNDPDIVTNTQCSVPILTLRASAFQLPWGSIVRAKVVAVNLYGSSLESELGGEA